MDLGKLSPDLTPVWRAVHARLSSGLPVSRVRVGPLDPRQREAVADLLGLERLPAEQLTISIAQLDEVLGDTRDAVERLLGPLGDRAAEKRHAERERAELREWLTGHPVVTQQPALLDWIAGTRRATREEWERALRVLERLPAEGMPLPVFADEVLGDPHALDDARMVLQALQAIYGEHDKRTLWELAGIAADELSSTVLTAGFGGGNHDVVSRIQRACTGAGQAAVLTLQQLKQASWQQAPAQVWIFENPSVLALGISRGISHPMVCTAGWPSSAAILLLRSLKEAGAQLLYHGDFDGEGLRIAANIMARTGAEPWHMGSEHYLAAVADGPPVGRVTPVPWDDELAEHLVRIGRSVPEERVAHELLGQLP